MTTWIEESVSSDASLEPYVGLVVDNLGQPVAAFALNDLVQFMVRSGGVWGAPEIASSLDPSGSRPLGLGVDTSNYPHIAYGALSTSDTRGCYKDITGWTQETIDDATGHIGGIAATMNLAESSLLVAFIASGGGLYYATYSGTWSSALLDAVGAGGGTPGLAIDASGNPHIGYRDTSDNVIHRWYDGAWQSETVETGVTGTVEVSVQMNTLGAVYMAYRKVKTLRYATKPSGGAWSAENVTTGVESEGDYCILRLDPNNAPHIAYRHVTSYYLKYAEKTTGSWVITSPETGAPSLSILGFDLDSLGYAHILVVDTVGGNHELRYVTGDVYAQPEESLMKRATTMPLWDHTKAPFYLGYPYNDFMGDALVAFKVHDVYATARTVDEKLAEVVSVKDFGATGNSSDDDKVAIQNAINYVVGMNKPGIVVLPLGTYRLNSGLTIRTDLVSLEGSRTKLDFSGMTTGTAITLTGNGTANPYWQNGSVLKGIELSGPGIASTVDALMFDTAAEGGTSHLSFSGVNVHDFRKGHIFRRNAYILDFYNCDIWSCATGIEMLTGYSNYGERITYFGCTIYSNTLGVSLTNADGAFHFLGCSFDYNTLQFNITAGRVFLTDCHVEATNYASEAIVVGTGNGATFVMRGGWMLCTGSNAQSLVSCTVTANQGGGAYFDGVYMNSLGSAKYFATGTGTIIVSNPFSYDTRANPLLLSAAANLLMDGGFETAVLDTIITADTVAITSRTTGTNVILTASTSYARTGSKSLKYAKAGAAATVSSFTILAPLTRRGATVGRRLWYKKPGAETGSLIVGYGFANIQTNDSNLPVELKAIAVGDTTITFTSAPVDWTELMSGEPVNRVPSWATHATIGINGLSIAGAASIYFDDIEITEM